MDHAGTIQTIADALRDRPDIRALFLSGSHANGMADDYSDIDFVLVADDGATDAIACHWRDAVAQTGEIVLWWDRTTVPVLINAITADWTRTDVIILKPDQLGAHSQRSLTPVFDHDNLYDGLATAPAAIVPNQKKALYQFQEFIRILGLLHLAVGRAEYINGVLGVYHLRNLLVDLMIEETGAPNRGGVLHLNRLITADQKAVLLALPAPVPEREAMIAAHLAYAKAYLPRARKRARQIGVDWPERFEAVTWEKLDQTLGIKRPYTPEV
ncbi:nucleotidyltransferase domain-containing protein [Pseudosulfitobacter pseudonitzschiae]|uniref:nucleotidyltransferase domain-containing protein n=1 Tax=Pseudosulfitobacter pseudonitzschiae TaxID=1402135 RepID=UPI001AF6FD74|nr:nucleotidyltransferase domain-containing protein [Pseudosulfitobacter pseudonitzschiae]MBM1813701.1 nucleotidyltransferase domain-containing protein [Pseudosulfitobacter pseudonitzschiae]MBM1830694.1 nucleotidyltransferase domain-containing protein [Pseudosulfitobacter pseudonitzschiae]MBM1835561.1 nucleotidyltransferase domain-containing protein [Pseudosulfitobacter pseudonitzschiae]MBM1840407.1 nucleotidyltransferase domain-containing protein [Pseudosulfitobacter pseudonitzschiae]MBM18456